MLPHPLFPQIPQGLFPVIIQELGNLLQMMVCHRVDISAELLESECGLRFAVRMVKDIDQLPDNTAEVVHKPLILACQLGNGLLSRLGGLLPTKEREEYRIKTGLRRGPLVTSFTAIACVCQLSGSPEKALTPAGQSCHDSP